MLTILHRGYNMTYAENMDNWRCWALDLEAETPGKLKAKIDRVLAQASKLEINVPAWRHDHRGWHRVMITSRVNFKAGSYAASKGLVKLWVTKTTPAEYAHQPDKIERSQAEATELFADTPEVRAMIAEHQNLVVEETRARNARHDYFEAMPRIDVAQFEPDVEPARD